MKLYEALDLIRDNYLEHQNKTPTFGTLLEELTEYYRATEGKHEHPPGLELVQIAGITLHLLLHHPFEDVRYALIQRSEENKQSHPL
jgi:hypothetical protein